MTNSLGKRRQNVDDNVPSKHSVPRAARAVPVTGDEWAHQASTSMSYTPQQTVLESPAYNDVPYNHDMLPLHVMSQSSVESPQREMSEPSQSDQVPDMSMSSQMVQALVASLPTASHVFQLIQPQSAHTTGGFTSQHAVEASVHPLLSMVQQVLPPLHDYSPPVPLSHAAYPSHAAPQPSHQALQPSYPSMDQPVHNITSSSIHQTSIPLLLTRTASSTTRGSSSHAKSTPPTPKVIIVSGTGMSSATTISGPPPPIVTTSVVTKPAPGFYFISFLH